MSSANRRSVENEYWRDLYKSAPVGAKRWLEGEFAASESEEEPPDGPDPDIPMIIQKGQVRRAKLG